MNLYIWELTTHGKDLEEAIAGFPDDVKELLRKNQPLIFPFPDGASHDQSLQEWMNIRNASIAGAICRAKDAIAKTKTKERTKE